MKMTTRTFTAVALAAGSASFAQAHPGHDGHDLTWDFQTGLTHPFTGLDHILALVAVGWWAIQLGGRARWLVPAVFLGIFAASAAVGHWASPPPATEQAIAASVLVMGLLVATAARLPISAAAMIVGAFAAFHGLAHGASIPLSQQALDYGSGFVVGSALLLGLGVLGGAWASHLRQPVARIAGTACAITGAILLLGQAFGA